jgi:O-antigen ligase
MWVVACLAGGTAVFSYITRGGDDYTVSIISWNRLFLVMAVFYSFLSVIRGSFGTFRLDWAALALIGYLLKVLLSVEHSIRAPGMVDMALLMVPLIVFGATQILIRTGEEAGSLARAIVFFALIPALFMPVEFLMQSNPLFPDYRGHGMYRAVGTLANPNRMGLYLLAVLPFAFHLHLTRRSLLTTLALLILPVAILTTISRKTLLLMPLVFLMFFMSRKYIKYLVPMALVGVITVFLAVTTAGPTFTRYFERRIQDSNEALDTRVAIAKAGWELFLDNPMMGVGHGNSRTMQHMYRKDRVGATDRERALHNQYLEVLAEQGVVGFLLFFLAIIVPLMKAWSAARREGDEGGLARAGMIAIVVFILGSFGGEFIFNLNTGILFWSICALVVASKRRAVTVAAPSAPGVGAP